MREYIEYTFSYKYIKYDKKHLAPAETIQKISNISWKKILQTGHWISWEIGIMRHWAPAAPEQDHDQWHCADYLSFPILVVTLVNLKRIEKVFKKILVEGFGQGFICLSDKKRAYFTVLFLVSSSNLGNF